MKQARMASTITDACRLRQEHNHYIICPSPEPIISVYSAFHFLLPCFASVLHLYFQRIYHTSACPSCRKAPSVNSPPAIESSVAPFASACFIKISVLILYARAVQIKRRPCKMAFFLCMRILLSPDKMDCAPWVPLTVYWHIQTIYYPSYPHISSRMRPGNSYRHKNPVPHFSYLPFTLQFN